MKLTHSPRGFEQLEHPTYLPRDRGRERLVAVSSIVGDYDDAFERPGTSALWVGECHHLNREEVAELVAHLQAWLTTGSLCR